MYACSVHAPLSSHAAQHAVLQTFQAIITHYKSHLKHANSREVLSTDFEGWILAQTSVLVTIELDPTSY